MSQMTIYLDDDVRRKIVAAARRSRTSVSRWVQEKLVSALTDQWPEGYFEVFGSLRDLDLKRPTQPKPSLDRRRAKL